jgi:UPF0755 protein
MPPQPKKRVSRPRRLLTVVIALGLLSAAVGYAFYTHLQAFADQPADPSAPEVVVEIPRGQGFSTVCQRLYHLGVVSNRWQFRLLGRIGGLEQQVQAGEYVLSGAMTPRQILQRLIHGKVRLHRLTIPEGYNLRHIAAAVGRSGLADEAAFLALASDPATARQMGLPADSLEGYLFPDTYAFPKGVSCRDIAAAMVDRFRQVFDERLQRRAAELGLSRHQVVTLASIIEKETGAAEERPLIASVFHNRLKRHMRLETDPTVIYGLSSFDGNLTRRHLKTPSPYNTYLNRGLPPGPIASPGAAALEAALYPAETHYLYFVARRDGTHQFSSTLAEHNRAVRKYQLRR